MAASRARNSDIGSERENSRIGTRRIFALLAAEAPGRSADLFRAIIDGPHQTRFASQQVRFNLIRYIYHVTHISAPSFLSPTYPTNHASAKKQTPTRTQS